jgi:hypothetical protein
MSSDDLEKLSPYLRDTSLAEALSGRYRKDKDLVASFWTVDNSILMRKGNRIPKLLADETEKLAEMIAARLGLKEP